MIGWFKRVVFGGEAGEVKTLPCTLHQFLYSDNNYKKKCIFIDATVSVLPQVIRIANLAYTGEQDDQEELQFPLDEGLDLTSYQIVDDEAVIMGYKWRNLDTDHSVQARLVGVEFTDSEDAQAFRVAVCKALHDLINPKIPFDESDIGTYCEEEGLERFSEVAQKTNPLEHNFLVATKVSAPIKSWSEPAAPNSNHEFNPQEQILLFIQNLYSLDKLLYVSAAHFFDHDPVTGDDLLLQENVCFILVKPKKGEFAIEVIRSDSVMHSYRLTRNFVYNVDIEAKQLMWAEEGTPPRCKLVTLAQPAESLKNQLSHCLFEISRGQAAEEALKPDELKWVTSVNYPDLEEESKSSESSEAVEVDWEVCDAEVNDEARNTLSTQSLVFDRTFVSRGPVVSVYQEQDNSLSKLFDMMSLQDRRGSSLTPEVVQLYNQDRNLLMLSADRKNIYNVDVERGQVVDEWQPGSSMKIQDIAPSKKYGPQTIEPTFFVVSPKTVALMDPRIPENSMIAQGKTYAKSYAFSSVASNSDGNLVVGSEKGEIRLYKQAGDAAKNLFPGLGEGITSIEVSASGHWVLATTPNALLLLPVGNESCNGFTERLGPLKQCPKRLTLKPQDVAQYSISEINFTPAKFDNGDTRRESAIITTTGAFMVIWSLKGIKRGKLYDYKIKRLDDSAVSAQFMYGRKDVVVTMPTRLELQKSKI